MTYFNNLGQGRVGWRSPSAAVAASTLSTSIYAVWNADTTSTVTTLGTGTFAAWNAEDVISSSQLSTNIFGVWNADGTNNLSVKHAWNANGDAVDSKSGANGTIATPSGTSWVPSTMTYGSGKLGSGAFTFNGSNFVSLPANTLKFTGDFSVSYWIYVPTAFGTNYSRVLTAFDNSAGYTTYKGWDTTYSNGTVSFYMYPGFGTDYYGITVPMTLKDQWVHVTVTKVLGQQGNIYINGVAGVKTVDKRGSGASTQAIAYNVSNLAYMGASYFAFSQPYYTPTVAGGFKQDAIQIWDGVALDQAAVTELYNSGNGQEYPFTLSNSLIPTYNDAVGSNHGTTPASTLTNGVPGPSFTTGKIGQAFNFDGINDFIQLPDNSLNSLTGDFSISFWMNLTNSHSSNSGMLFSNIQFPVGVSTYYGWQLSFYNGQIYFIVGSNTGNSTSSTRLVSNTLTSYIGNWVHVTCTHKQSTGYKIYVNGTLNNSNTGTYNPVYTTNHTPSIGAQYSLNSSPNLFYPLNGKIDALNVWNRELTTDEITALYNSGNGQQYPFSNVTLSGVTSDALGNYNGTNNGVTFTTGKTGTSAFSFNGSSNYIALPQAALNFNKGNSGQSIGDFSVSFWVNLNTGSGDYQTIISNWGSNGYGWQVLVYGGSFILFGSDGSNGSTARIQHSVGLSKTNAINQWVHVVVTYTNQSQVKSYVNGVLTNTSSTTYQVRTNSRNNGIIGAWPQEGDNSGTKYWYLNGKLDAVTLWTKALTDAEASALYNNGTGYQYSFPSSATGYLSSYNDAVGSNHGTTPASTITNGVPGPTFTAGKIGHAFNFDGINDIVRLSNNSLDLTGDFSISMWVNWGRNNTSQILMSNFTIGASTRGWFIEHAAGQLRFRGFNSTGGNAFYILYSYVPPLNTWIHYTFVHKNNSNKMYADGVLIGSDTGGSTHVAYDTPNYPLIGANQYNATTYQEFFLGKIDAVNVWNRELSASEVTDLYNSGNGKQYPY